MENKTSTTDKSQHDANVHVSKSFIAVSSNNEYWEGESYVAECADYMGVLGFEKEKALRMTEAEAKEVCDRYKSAGLKAINVC